MITIKKARENEYSIILEILNSTTQALINKGINQWTLPWDKDLIKKEINENRIFILEEKGKVYGTFSIRDIKEADNNIYNLFQGYYVYRIAIISESQGCGIGKLLLNELKEKYSVFYLDCWAGNDKLKKFYCNSELKYIGDYPEDNYYISVFRSR